MKIILIFTLSFILVSCGAPTATNKQDYNNSEGRAQYARGLEATAKIGGSSASFTAYDADKTTLFITSNKITEKECSDFKNSDYARDAATIGFKKITCRNEDRKDQWSFPL